MSSPPDSAAIRTQLQQALALAQSGRREQAIAALRALCAREPAQVSARCLLGALLQENGDSAGALAELDSAAACAPHDVRVQETRAALLFGQQRYAEAETAARAALALAPERPHALLHLGLALDAQQRSAEAVPLLVTLLAITPQHGLARRLLARNRLRLGDTAGALEAALHASVLDDAALGADVAAEFYGGSPPAIAAELLRALAERHPRHFGFCLTYARLLHQSGRSGLALEWSERAHALAPQALEPLEMRAVSLIDRGDVDAGLALYDTLLAHPDADAELAGRHLILLHYDPRQDNDALFAAHRRWAQRYARAFGAPWRPRAAATAPRRLRVAWISPRFEEGPVARFFSALIEAFEREGFEHHLVALRPERGAAGARLRAAADVWHALHDLDDVALLQRLRAAEFDIAIDLAGHSFGNRLRVLAQRIAPVQLCWLDYFDTTGVDAMDGWISDAWLTPDGSPQRYSERLLRLPSGRFCYTPPPAAAPERRGDGPPAFVAFNRLAKCNDAVLDAWAEILRRVPDATLEIGTALLADATVRTRTLERFATRGIGPERLRLQPERDYVALLDAYRDADIALDPFPFSGCTTTCDALWMGVPVIALSGSTFVARQSASLLERLGRPEWIARDAADYVERAVALAGDVDALRARRGALRATVQATLCDAAAQARDFAALLRSAWDARARDG